MFWNKRYKLPITEADKVWVEEALNWLKDSFGSQHFNEIATVRPNRDYFDYTFTGKEEDAEYVLNRVAEFMAVKTENIELEFISDGFVESSEGGILTSPGDINGKWEGAAGTYQQSDSKTIISIEQNQLKNPESLIATVAHELAHVILLGENRIEENDEYLTDLTAIFMVLAFFWAIQSLILMDLQQQKVQVGQ